jgi:hypothetical protein
MPSSQVLSKTAGGRQIQSLAKLDHYRWNGHGVALAEAARQVGVSTSAVSKILKGANQ